MVVAKKYAPSLIYIDECEKIFPGKKKKKKGEKKVKKKANDPTNPARIKKALIKWKAKWITDETRITVVACSSEPHEGGKKDFVLLFKLFHARFFSSNEKNACQRGKRRKKNVINGP